MSFLTLLPQEQVAAFKQELTLHLMRSLPQLLRKYQSDPVRRFLGRSDSQWLGMRVLLIAFG